MQNQAITKVVVSACISDFRNKALMKQAKKDLCLITGQKPAVRTAKKSIASFKIRQDQKIGYKVTLRRKKMQDFIKRLVNLAIPRIRDFRGLKSDSFDGQGNLTIGIREQSIFPEINPEKSPLVFGLEVTMVNNIKDNKSGIKLLKKLGFPIQDAA